MTSPRRVPADDADFASALSYRDYKNLGLSVNPSRGGASPSALPRPAAAQILAALAAGLLLALAGCQDGAARREGAGSPEVPAVSPPAAARPPEKTPPASREAAQAAAQDPRSGPNPALRDLEKKIVPPEGGGAKSDTRAAAAAVENRLQEEAEQMAHDLVKEIDGEEADKARDRLVTEKDLEAVALEGVRTILAASLVPENRAVLASLIQSGRGKEVGINLWVPGRIQRTERGSLYRESVPMMREATLELDVGGKRTTLGVDLILIGGRWKVFKLEPKEEE